jgi:phosphate transport system substrate-binding protein
MFGFMKNDSAVSPIVATLVLIVVAIIGAAAVGTLMGAFSNDVSEQANAKDVGNTAATNIIVAGSTTVQPVSEILAETYMESHPGIKITVQGGGSDAGIASAGMGIVDIGAASKNLDDAAKNKYPELKEYQIGGSAVVIIANAASVPAGTTTLEFDDIYALFTAGTDITLDASHKLSSGVQRAEGSGTEETFAKWLTAKTSDGGLATTQLSDIDTYSSVTKSAIGNAGVLKLVQDNPEYVGFVDYGYAKNAPGIVILGVVKGAGTGLPYDDSYTPGDIAKDIKNELKLQNEASYITKLTRPLVFITNGEAGGVAKDFINFAMSPGSIDSFAEAGCFSIVEFA